MPCAKTSKLHFSPSYTHNHGHCYHVRRVLVMHPFALLDASMGTSFRRALPHQHFLGTAVLLLVLILAANQLLLECKAGSFHPPLTSSPTNTSSALLCSSAPAPPASQHAMTTSCGVGTQQQRADTTPHDWNKRITEFNAHPRPSTP